MKHRFFAPLFPLAALLGAALPVQAEEPSPLSVQLSTGFILSAQADNLDPDGSKNAIPDLNSSADREYTFLPVLLPTAEWDVGEPGGVGLYFNTKQPLLDAGSLVFNLGASYDSPLPAIFELDLFYTPFEEVWENPYVTGSARHTSDTSKFGAALTASNILASRLSVGIAYMADDVEDDLLAELFPELARDGSVYGARVEYTFNVSGKFDISPGLTVVKGDYDGDSSSYGGYRLSLKGLYLAGKWLINPELYYGYREYDETDPVFNEDRETDRYGCKLLANYRAPFGWQDWTATALLGYSRGESSIAFYDTESATLGMFLVYLF